MTLSKKMLGHQLKGRTGLYTITKKLQDSVSGYVFLLCLPNACLTRNRHPGPEEGSGQKYSTLSSLEWTRHYSSFPTSLTISSLASGWGWASSCSHTKALGWWSITRSKQPKTDTDRGKICCKRSVESIGRFAWRGCCPYRCVSTNPLQLSWDNWSIVDIKPTNVLVDHGHDEHRSSDFQLANFGSTVHIDSSYARDGESIGTPIFGSPEAQLQMRWGSATDIWSFGTMVAPLPCNCTLNTSNSALQLINLIYGEGFHIFKPNVPVDHDEYDLKISWTSSVIRSVCCVVWRDCRPG